MDWPTGHSTGIEKNQHHKDINGALLCEPETELVSSESDGIQRFDKDNAEHIADQRPDDKADGNQSQIGLPIRSCVFHTSLLFLQFMVPSFSILG